MNHIGHEILKCRCGVVLRQCHCAIPKPTVISSLPCNHDTYPTQDLDPVEALWDELWSHRVLCKHENVHMDCKECFTAKIRAHTDQIRTEYSGYIAENYESGLAEGHKDGQRKAYNDVSDKLADLRLDDPQFNKWLRAELATLEGEKS